MNTTAAERARPTIASAVEPLERLVGGARRRDRDVTRRIRHLDPLTTVSWLLTVGLALLVMSVLLATPLVPAYPEDAFRVPWTLEHQWDTPVSLGRLQAWLWLANLAGLSAVVGILVARRRVALGTALAAWPFVAVPLFGTFVWGWWLALASVAVVAAFSRARRAVVPFLISVAIMAVFNHTLMEAHFPGGQGTMSGGDPGWWAVLGTAAYTGAAVAVSAAVSAGLRSRARTAAARETERHALEVESTSVARTTLARDLHDVVAHHVSLVAVRAESAPYAHPDLGEDARRVLADIATDARSALTELRRVLAILQRSDETPLTPQPGADDVVALVTEAQAAGQVVERLGAWPDVPEAHGYVLYRAAQEGLTNARRHAPGAAVAFTLQERDGVVGFRMANPTDPAGGVEPGRGLIGMRERVESLGGAVSAEVDGGTFALVVTLPLDVP